LQGWEKEVVFSWLEGKSHVGCRGFLVFIFGNKLLIVLFVG